MAKIRVSIQVSPLFRDDLIKRMKIVEQKENKDIGMREFTEKIANMKLLDDIEKKLIQKINPEDIKLNFDRRIRI